MEHDRFDHVRYSRWSANLHHSLRIGRVAEQGKQEASRRYQLDHANDLCVILCGSRPVLEPTSVTHGDYGLTAHRFAFCCRAKLDIASASVFLCRLNSSEADNGKPCVRRFLNSSSTGGHFLHHVEEPSNGKMKRCNQIV